MFLRQTISAQYNVCSRYFDHTCADEFSTGGCADSFFALTPSKRRAVLGTWNFAALAGLALHSEAGQTIAIQALQTDFFTYLTTALPNVFAFIHIIDSGRAVIIGECVAQFLDDRGSALVTQIELCTPSDTFVQVVRALEVHLRAILTEECQPWDAGHNEDRDGILEWRVLTTDYASIKVNRCSSESAFHKLPFAYQTKYATAISSRGITVAYPWSLLRDRSQPSSTITDARRDTFHMSDLLLGIDMLPVDEEPDAAVRGECSRQLRHFGDEHCLTFHFDNPFVVQTVPDHDSTASWTTAWIFGGERCNPDTCVEDCLPTRFARMVPTRHTIFA